MSHQAVAWAIEQPVKHSPAKHILTVMGHYVSVKQQPWIAYPSVTQLAKDTGQDRKTVIGNIKRLVEWGYLVDSGERAGITKSVTIFILSDPQSSTSIGIPSNPESSTKSGTAIAPNIPPEAVPEQGQLSSTNIGAPSPNGSSTSFFGKQYQIPPEAVPVFPTEQVEQVLGTGEDDRRAHARTHVREAEPSSSDAAEKRTVQVAVLLRRNGADARTHSTSRGIAEIAALQATDVQILTALESAKRQREKSGSQQPVTAAYLVPIVAELRQAPPPKPGSRFANDIEQMREMSAWADDEIRRAKGQQRPSTEIDMGAIDATHHD